MRHTINIFLLIGLAACAHKASREKVADDPLQVGDRVCAAPCPKVCDLVVKEFAHGGVWTEPACYGPIGYYPPESLWLAAEDHVLNFSAQVQEFEGEFTAHGTLESPDKWPKDEGMPWHFTGKGKDPRQAIQGLLSDMDDAVAFPERLIPQQIRLPDGWHPENYGRDQEWSAADFCSGDVLFEAAPPSCMEVHWCYENGEAGLRDRQDCGDFDPRPDDRDYFKPLPWCPEYGPAADVCKERK